MDDQRRTKSQAHLKGNWTENRRSLKVFGAGQQLQGGVQSNPRFEGFNMTMLGNVRPFPAISIPSRGGLRLSLVGRSRRLVDRVVAAIIARHQREVEIFVLRNLTDRELNDIGICRGEIGLRSEDAERMRAQLQMKRSLPMFGGNPTSSASES
jgi:uncharacterized protein YjiS (DUF1127 family)